MVIELSGVQFWSEIILVISNRTRAARSFDFEITRDFRPSCTPLSSITVINFVIILQSSLRGSYQSSLTRDGEKENKDTLTGCVTN